MKKIFILGTFLLASTVMFAQDTTPAQRAEKRTAEMSQSLQLTAEQKVRVQELLTGIEMKIEAAKNEPTFTEAQRAEQIQGNKDAEMMILKDILTQEQYARHEQALKATRKTNGTGATKTSAPTQTKQKATN